MSDGKAPDNRNVCTEIVAHNLCVGCGLCAGVCPKETLEISFNDHGEYVPRDVGGACAPKCDFCLSVCPFFDHSDDEDTLGMKLFGDVPGIAHRPETGYYLKSFVGYSKVHDHRANGASGGLATWMLETLLEEDLVDRVACVGPARDGKALLKFAICSSAEEIRQGSRSCYYPVEASEVVRYVLSNEGRYAVIALQCCVKAFRLAMQRHPKLRQRVKFLLGLVCGQGKSAFFAEYICALGGGDPNRLDAVRFRLKDPARRTSDYGTWFRSNGGSPEERTGVVHQSKGPAKVWIDRCFTPRACNFCEDTFAELADATFMDAWLPAYDKDNRGNSIVIARNQAAVEILQRGVGNGALALQELRVGDVIASQKTLPHRKRHITQEWRRLAANAGQRVPRKRSVLFSRRLSFLDRRLAQATWEICVKSRDAWPSSGKNLAQFEKAMSRFMSRTARIRMLQRFLQKPWTLPGALFRRVRRVLGGLR